MAELTRHQRAFLASHNISMSDVFDVSGMKQRQYKPIMKKLGASFAYGAGPCRVGHTLYTRAGHCIQCDTAKIAFMKRNSAKGTVYIAGSYTLKLIKVGVAGDVRARIESLNVDGYGGASDWEVLAFIRGAPNAGKLEFNTHEELSKYSFRASYERQGHKVDCLELFSCDIITARAALKKVAGTGKLKLDPTANEERLLKVYDFPNRESAGA